ncbi:MAG: sulfotransferase [Gammaproteobacteria bacterium]|nr:sulfotransferase [Gammaproteobacteria bacterium]
MPMLEALVREADSLRLAGRDSEAEAAYLRLLSRWPALPDSWFNLGVVQRRIGRFEAALDSYQQALTRGIRRPEEVHLNRAFVYSECLRQDEAAARELNEALRLSPAYVPALLNLAKLHEDRGEREPAAALYERALVAEPRSGLPLARLANLLPRGAQDEALIERLRAAISRPETSVAERAELGFALGRALDGRAEYRAAFAAYLAANRDSRATAPPAIAPYDRAAQERVTGQLLRAPLPPPLPGRSVEAPRPRPIFICGMFRSGSTLAEQLIAGAPGVEPGGELNVLPALIGRALQPFPEALATASQALLGGLADEYRQWIARAFPGAAYVTDKRPDNFFFIGLIKTLFPDALVVHTTRDPLDTCLSVFFLHLDHQMSYALDLMDTGHFYRQYRRLMAHWKKLYGSAIVDFDYDAFVRDPEPTAAALFAALGLPWDPQLLDFPRSSRAVRTASAWQVREPLYRDSSGRARHYGPELAPLREYLADLLPARPDEGGS